MRKLLPGTFQDFKFGLLNVNFVKHVEHAPRHFCVPVSCGYAFSVWALSSGPCSDLYMCLSIHAVRINILKHWAPIARQDPNGSCVYIYIYTYTFICKHIYIYIYICIYTSSICSLKCNMPIWSSHIPVPGEYPMRSIQNVLHTQYGAVASLSPHTPTCTTCVLIWVHGPVVPGSL